MAGIHLVKLPVEKEIPKFRKFNIFPYCLTFINTVQSSINYSLVQIETDKNYVKINEHN